MAQVRRHWKVLAVGALLLLLYLVSNLAIGLATAHQPGIDQSAAAYTAADQARTEGLAARSLHPFVWQVPAPYARQQLDSALTIETRYIGQFRLIRFPLSLSCDARQLLQSSEDLAAAETILIQQSWQGSLSRAQWQSYLDASASRAAAARRLEQDLGLRPRILFVNYWPSFVC